jgi:hypothetical protein
MNAQEGEAQASDGMLRDALIHIERAREAAKIGTQRDPYYGISPARAGTLRENLRFADELLRAALAAREEPDTRAAELFHERQGLIRERDLARSELVAAREDTGRPEEEQEFLDASIAVWREIDRLSGSTLGYQGLENSSGLRIRERAAWERYRDAKLDVRDTAHRAAREDTERADVRGWDDSRPCDCGHRYGQHDQEYGTTCLVEGCDCHQLRQSRDTERPDDKELVSLRACGDRLQSESSRITEWMRTSDVKVPYEVMQAMLEVESAVRRWTEIRRKTEMLDTEQEHER